MFAYMFVYCTLDYIYFNIIYNYIYIYYVIYTLYIMYNIMCTINTYYRFKNEYICI